MYNNEELMEIFEENIYVAKIMAQEKIIECLKNNQLNKNNDFKMHFEIGNLHFFVYDVSRSSVAQFNDISRTYTEILECMENNTYVISIDIYDMETMKMSVVNTLFLVQYKDTYVGTYFNWENAYSSLSVWKTNYLCSETHLMLKEFDNGIHYGLHSRYFVKEYETFKFVIESSNTSDGVIPNYSFRYYIVFPYFNIIINRNEILEMLNFDDEICDLIRSLYMPIEDLSKEQKKNIVNFLGRTVNILFNPLASFKRISVHVHSVFDNCFVLKNKDNESNETIKEKHKLFSNMILRKAQGMKKCNVDELKRQNPIMSSYNVIDFDIGGVIEDNKENKEFMYVKTRLGNIAFSCYENVFQRHKKIIEDKYEKFKYTQKKLNSKNFN